MEPRPLAAVDAEFPPLPEPLEPQAASATTLIAHRAAPSLLTVNLPIRPLRSSVVQNQIADRRLRSGGARRLSVTTAGNAVHRAEELLDHQRRGATETRVLVRLRQRKLHLAVLLRHQPGPDLGQELL